MKLFSSDRFSDHRIHLSELKKQSEKDLLIKIFETFETQKIISSDCIDKIYAFGEIGINSSNYLISTRKGKFVLKRSSNQCADHLDKYCKLSNSLKNEIDLFPNYYKNNLQVFFTHEGDSNYVLLKHIEGSYFQGSKLQLEQFAGAIKSIRSLGSVKKNNHALPSRDHDIQKNIQTLKHFLDSRSNANFLTQKQNLFVSQHIAKFYEALDLISEINDLDLGAKELVHIDLHPHNILFSDESITGILDIDSFKWGDPCTAYGFAAYKLYRQSISHNKNITKDHSIHEFIYDIGLDCGTRISLLGALAEVSTRACFILEPLLQGSDSPWLDVLEIQLLGILEIMHLLEEKP